MTPEERLEVVTREFEAQFKSVTVFDPEIHKSAGRCPKYNLPYTVFHNGIAKVEGAPSPPGGTSSSPEEAVRAFASRVRRWGRVGAGEGDLFWRVRPCLESAGGQHRVYCRAAWV